MSGAPGAGVSLKMSLAGLVVAALMIWVGWLLLNQVGDLANRTERTLAVYEDGLLTYETASGDTVTIPKDDSCKHYSEAPSRRCLARFANGDEVLVTFDSADPTRTWRGPTPGGFLATGLFWGGIAVGIFALLWLWFSSPLYRRIRRPTIPGEHPPSVD